MRFEEAWPIAQGLVEELRPYCQRIDVAGSLRRQREEVNDIEIVLVPETAQGTPDLFGAAAPMRHPGLIEAINRYPAVRGCPTGRYTRRIVAAGIEADVFIARPENWGLILALRTGSANFCKTTLAPAWVREGYRSDDGMLTRGGRQYPVPDEHLLFRMCRLPWITPENRI